jgi:hypothetical protein
MALSAITVSNTDHFSKGGVKKLTLGIYDATTLVDVDVTAQTAVESSLVLGASTAVIDFEKETANMTISATQERGLMMFTVSVEGYVAKISDGKLKAIQAMVGEALVAKVETYDGKDYVVGFDGVLGTGEGSTGTTTDFPLFLESVEGGSGSALADGTGLTLKLTAVQGALPYVLA